MKWEPAYEDWKAGMKYKEIAGKYGVSENTVKSWAARYFKPKQAGDAEKVATSEDTKLQPKKDKLQPPAAPKSFPKRSCGAPKGNQNARGNRGGAPKGNVNALRHGFYYDALSPEERDWIDQRGDIGEEQRILNELALWEIKERRLLLKIREYEQAKNGIALQSVQKGEKGTSTVAVSAFTYIQRLESLLIQAQRGHLRCIMALDKIRARRRSLYDGDMPDTASDREDIDPDPAQESQIVFYIPDNGRGRGKGE